MASRIISQEAFDEVVRENMSEFDMTAEEAIADAVQQFEAQHVNLSNIIKNMVQLQADSGKHPLTAALEDITKQLEAPGLDPALVLPLLGTVRNQCAIDLAHRCLAGRKGQETLFTVLMRALDLRNLQLVDVALAAMTALLDSQPDVIADSEMFSLVNLLRRSGGGEDTVDTEWLSDGQLVAVCEVLRQSCFMHEGNRQTLVTQGIIPLAVALLGSKDDEKTADRAIVSEVCRLLRSLTVDDDIRVPFSKAHDHAKAIVTETPALEMLLLICRKFKEVDDNLVVAEAFVTLSKLSVRNEFCQQLLDCGGVSLIFESLANHLENQQIVRSSLLLIKSLAGNDNVKLEVHRCGGIVLIASAMQKFVSNAGIAQNGSAAVAAVCLRQPDICRKAVDVQVPAILAQIFKLHADKPEVMRSACLAVRNIVSRSPDLCSIFVTDLGFEELLKAIYDLCPEEAKSALRDLGCAITLNEPWTGEKGHIVQ